MLDFKVIYSGSSGNCCLMYSKNTKILIDFGRSAKSINDAITSIGLNPYHIDAIFITHEHEDHIKGLKNVSKYFSCPVYCLKKCFDYIVSKKKCSNGTKFRLIQSKFCINDILIVPFKTMHDSLDSCGFSFILGDEKISYVTDLGTFTDEVYDSVKGSRKIVIESNYDDNLIKFSNYPIFLKKRIASSVGHLSNNQCANAILRLAKSGTLDFTLAHISEKNNSPELALQIVKSMFYNTHLEDSIHISLANKDALEPFLQEVF